METKEQIKSRIKELDAYIKKYENLEATIKEFPKKMTQKIYIPIGNHAFMYGKVKHTNEFLCKIGLDYFVWKTSYETVDFLKRHKKLVKCELKGQTQKLKMLKENPNITFNKDGTIDIHEPYIEKKKLEKEEENSKEDKYIKQSRLMDQYHEEAIKNGILPPTDVYTEEEEEGNVNNGSNDDELIRKLHEIVKQEEEIEKQKQEEIMKRKKSNNRRCNFCNNPDPQFKCVKCKCTYYCSKECQKADWKKHKKVCEEPAKELTLPPPPAPHLIDDSDSAFNGKVIEHPLYEDDKNDISVKRNKIVEEEEEQPKRISKFKQRRMNKE